MTTKMITVTLQESSVWDLIEHHHPKFHHDDRVATCNDLMDKKRKSADDKAELNRLIQDLLKETIEALNDGFP